ncbi:ABC-three component system protein [Sphingobium sp. WCS2017Hpa-17]|uniref:ABC-three component system protein n=1 Tax=Sphingobium sp. WCS2017Hpa-17 TaxID=3073638 RepID=UPI0028890039|nr:ABC-three component system protein [Sphingobium sp. WCS2017Hpa-17]
MIRSISSTLPSFKALTFEPGLNILLADVAEQSTDRHTRNSAGKTSLVEILHFLLGSEAGKGSLFKHEALINHIFTVEFFLADRWVRASRSGTSDDRIILSSADAEALGFAPARDLFDSDDTPTTISVDSWKAILGSLWFGLPAHQSDSTADTKGAPTFRQLAGYFARRRKSGGLNSIEKNSSDQQPSSWQVSLSYLLGLDWRVARRFQDMRDRKKVISALGKAIKDGELGQIFGTTAEIRPELARVEEQIERLRAQVGSFQVHESYRELAAQASALKDRANEITFALAEAESAVDYITKALEQEIPPGYADVERLYAAAGVELPDVALRRFDEVKAFQASVATNRRLYLRQQIDEIVAQRDDLTVKLQDASDKRTRILQSLDGKGAFEDLIRLREQFGEMVSRAETLRSKLQHAATLENNKVQLKAEAADLELALQHSHEQAEDCIKRATVLVDHAIRKLYDDRTGNLIIEASRTGPKFRIEIQGGGNKGGIDMMKLFCFDAALLRIAYDRFKPGPGILVHDSHLFDGVDSRQVAQALVFGMAIAEEVGGQYIVALNSDEFDKADLASDVRFQPYVNSVKLTDDEAGGLFGFRFDLE